MVPGGLWLLVLSPRGQRGRRGTPIPVGPPISPTSCSCSSLKEGLTASETLSGSIDPVGGGREEGCWVTLISHFLFPVGSTRSGRFWGGRVGSVGGWPNSTKHPLWKPRCVLMFPQQGRSRKGRPPLKSQAERWRQILVFRGSTSTASTIPDGGSMSSDVRLQDATKEPTGGEEGGEEPAAGYLQRGAIIKSMFLPEADDIHSWLSVT